MKIRNKAWVPALLMIASLSATAAEQRPLDNGAWADGQRALLATRYQVFTELAGNVRASTLALPRRGEVQFGIDDVRPDSIVGNPVRYRLFAGEAGPDPNPDG